MYDNDKARVGHDATDFAAYGLSNLRDQYGNRDNTVAPYTDKINDAFIFSSDKVHLNSLSP